MKIVTVIPARYKSSRFPGKPLICLHHKPMILWVAELSARAVGKDNVFVATEDKRIFDVVSEAGFNSVMTSDDALTGTDRIFEAAKQIDADVYINVQGDEPLLDPSDILKIRDCKLANIDAIINGYCWISNDEDPNNVNIPKVITNENDKLIYMSRRLLPGYKDPAHAPTKFKKQVCIYAFTKQELFCFGSLGRKSFLESCEDIEILRFLEFEKKIIMVETNSGSLAVDVPEDIEPVEKALKRIHNL